jgi:hypothetical protein
MRYATGQGRQSWTCTGCGHHVHPTAGTIFHKSSTSLGLWFHAMYLMTSTRCGISAKQLERERLLRAWRGPYEHGRRLLRQPQDRDARDLRFVSQKWLQSYLDEYAYRYNERFRGERSMFHNLLDRAAE